MAERLAPSSPGTCCNTSIYWTTEVRWWPCFQAIAIAANEHLASSGHLMLFINKRMGKLPSPEIHPKKKRRMVSERQLLTLLGQILCFQTWKAPGSRLRSSSVAALSRETGELNLTGWFQWCPMFGPTQMIDDDSRFAVPIFINLDLGTESRLWRQSSTTIKCEHSDGKVQ